MKKSNIFNLEYLTDLFKKRNWNKINADDFLELQKRFHNKQHEVEQLRAEINEISRSMPCDENIKKCKEIKEIIKEKEKEYEKIKKEYMYQVSIIPNSLDASVPIGLNEEDNKEIFRKGTCKEVINHHTIKNIFSKTNITGSRFFKLIICSFKIF